MVEAFGEFRADESRHQNDRENAPNVADERKQNGKSEDHDFFPKPVLSDVNVNRGQHCHCGQRSNPAASFRDHEIETVVAGGQSRSDRINMKSDELAQCSDRSGDHKLKPERRLFDGTERDEEDQKHAREKNYPRSWFAPDIKDAAVN